MRLSRSNQAFGLTGLLVATIGIICYMSSTQRTSINQSFILLTSGSSLLLIASLNILVNQINLLIRRYFNPMSGWTPRRKASIFNFKG